MADKKISELPEVEGTTAEDLLLIVDNPNETPSNKCITVGSFFTNIPVEGSFDNGVKASHVKAQAFTVNERVTPASSSDTTSMAGNVAYDDTFLYIKVSPTVIRRVRLETF